MKTSRLGFGLIEVVVASLVLGFLIVGLLYLQKGNREGILRVRARDAANFVANHVLDSIAATGMKAIEKNNSPDGNCSVSSRPSTYDRIYCTPDYKYYFEGKPHSDKTKDGIKIKVAYTVEVFILPSDNAHPTAMMANDSTLFTKANSENRKNDYSQSLEAVVSWDFKDAKQSISMSRRVQ